MLQSLRPDLPAAGLKDSTPSAEMAGAWENRVAGEELQAMRNETFSESPTPADMPEAQVLPYAPEFSAAVTLVDAKVNVGA
jgi:hypothetical protein